MVENTAAEQASVEQEEAMEFSAAEERVEDAVDTNDVDSEEDRFEGPRVIRRDTTRRRRKRQNELLREASRQYLDRVSSQQGADDASGRRKRNPTTPTKVVGGKAGKERMAVE
jgi:hypothetical protein